MASLAVSYVIAWVAVVIYVSWLVRQNRQLERQLRDLTSNRNVTEINRPTSRAA